MTITDIGRIYRTFVAMQPQYAGLRCKSHTAKLLLNFSLTLFSTPSVYHFTRLIESDDDKLIHCSQTECVLVLLSANQRGEGGHITK